MKKTKTKKKKNKFKGSLEDDYQEAIESSDQYWKEEKKRQKEERKKAEEERLQRRKRRRDLIISYVYLFFGIIVPIGLILAAIFTPVTIGAAILMIFIIFAIIGIVDYD